MRITAMCLVLGAMASAGCLRSTQFKCLQNTDCGATGVCEAVGYCSFPNSDCSGTGRSFGDSAGQGLSNTCVPGNSPPGPDAGVDAPVSIDAPPQGCPSPYVAVNGSAHLYKVLANVSWDTAANDCKLTSASAYLAVPDDATELMNLATVAVGTPFWVGIDDQDHNDIFTTQKGGATATFLPWVTNPPDRGPPPKDCVTGISMTQITTDKCGTGHIAVCECEP